MHELSNTVIQVSKTAHGVPNLYDKKTKVNQRVYQEFRNSYRSCLLQKFNKSVLNQHLKYFVGFRSCVTNTFNPPSEYIKDSK